jgi:type III pantothenate kinase
VNPNVVVDIGNTRIKWGLCDKKRVVEIAALPPEEAAWQEQLSRWRLRGNFAWVIASVHPGRADALSRWLVRQGGNVSLIHAARALPLTVQLPEPDKVGMDRLLNAVAANKLRSPHLPAVIVDAGSAVTVDYLDNTGAFRGGAIFPGFRLMAKALHDYTALLPVVEISTAPAAVGAYTTAAMQAGIFWTVVGGIRTLLERQAAGKRTELFLTGGDAASLAPEFPGARVVPTLTLDGILQTAQHHSFPEQTP